MTKYVFEIDYFRIHGLKIRSKATVRFWKLRNIETNYSGANTLLKHIILRLRDIIIIHFPRNISSPSVQTLEIK